MNGADQCDRIGNLGIDGRHDANEDGEKRRAVPGVLPALPEFKGGLQRLKPRYVRNPPQRSSRTDCEIAPLGRSSLISKRESKAVVLRRDGEQAQEAAAHRFLRAEAATLRDTLDRRA